MIVLYLTILIPSVLSSRVADRVITQDLAAIKVREHGICKLTCNNKSDCKGRRECVYWGICPQKICMKHPSHFGFGVVDRCNVCNPNKGPNMTNPDCGNREECVWSPWCRAWYVNSFNA